MADANNDSEFPGSVPFGALLNSPPLLIIFYSHTMWDNENDIRSYRSRESRFTT